jgi:hypothetical protein
MTVQTLPIRLVLVAVCTMLAISGCGRPDYESPIINEDVPVIDIAQLPDIEQTTTEMIDLIERVRREVTRLVPAAEPWEWTDDQTGSSCVQEETGQKGVRRYLRNLVSDHAFSDVEWEIVFPAVRQLAAGAGLTDIAAPQNKPGNHDMRFSSDDGRTLIFGSRVASVITGRIACRLSA